jgi:hypothetical protein
LIPQLIIKMADLDFDEPEVEMEGEYDEGLHHQSYPPPSHQPYPQRYQQQSAGSPHALGGGPAVPPYPMPVAVPQSGATQQASSPTMSASTPKRLSSLAIALGAKPSEAPLPASAAGSHAPSSPFFQPTGGSSVPAGLPAPLAQPPPQHFTGGGGSLPMAQRPFTGGSAPQTPSISRHGSAFAVLGSGEALAPAASSPLQVAAPPPGAIPPPPGYYGASATSQSGGLGGSMRGGSLRQSVPFGSLAYAAVPQQAPPSVGGVGLAGPKILSPSMGPTCDDGGRMGSAFQAPVPPPSFLRRGGAAASPSGVLTAASPGSSVQTPTLGHSGAAGFPHAAAAPPPHAAPAPPPGAIPVAAVARHDASATGAGSLGSSSAGGRFSHNPYGRSPNTVASLTQRPSFS